MILLSQMLVSCGDNSEFRVAGEITGMGTQNLRIFYYADGAVQSVTSAALDGKFRFAGNSKNPTIVEIFSSNRTFIGRVMVKNGEEINCKFDRNDRYNVSLSGNDVSSEWGKFLRDNAGTFATGDYSLINKAVAGYVAKHRNNMLSTVLLLTEYHVPDNELEADSLLQSIAPEACPEYLVEGFRHQLAEIGSAAARGEIYPMNLYCSADSLYGYNPEKSSVSVLCFTSSGAAQRDSAVAAMRLWSKDYKPSRLQIVDISFATDTAVWHEDIRNDSASWTQCWAPGSVAEKSIERLSIPRTPYFIVVDSLGHQLYRGMSLHKAASCFPVNENL